MATITPTNMQGTGSRSMAVTTLGASDTFVFKSGRNQVLVLDNVTAGALTPNIDGDGSTTVSVSGAPALDVSGGYTTASIAAGAKAVIPLDSISAYLKGTITITGGDGIEASLLEY